MKCLWPAHRPPSDPCSCPLAEGPYGRQSTNLSAFMSVTQYFASRCPKGEPRTDDYDPHPPHFRGRLGRFARCAGYGGGAVSGPVTSAVDTGSASDRLQALGLGLPSLGGDPNYVNHRTVDSSIYISGQLPYKDGELLGQGIVGRDIDAARRRGSSRAMPRSTRSPSLRRRWEIWTGSGSCRCWSSWPVRRSFGEQSRVANAASDLLIEVLGENGRHARTAIGVAGLPLNSPVEIQMVCTAV